MFIAKSKVLVAALLCALGFEATASEGPQADSRVDRYGDALPPGALTRLGTIRYRFRAVGVQFLPDSKTVVSVGEGKAIIFWDARTGSLLREIDTGALSVGREFAYSRDAKHIAVSGTIRDEQFGWRNLIRVYDTASGKELQTFQREPREGVNALALTPDGKLVFSIGREGHVRIEEVATGTELLRQKFPGDVIASLVLSPDGATLALSSGPNSRKLFVWKWQTGEEPRELKTPDMRGSALAFSPDGKLLADCSDISATVRLWDVSGGKLLHKLELPDHGSYRHSRVVFSPDGKAVVGLGQSNDGQAVHMWDPATGKFLRRLQFGGGGLAFSPDGRLLAAGARVWDFTADKELSANDEVHSSAVSRIVTGPDNLIVTASDDNTMRIWDAATGQQRRGLVHGRWIRDIARSPDGTKLVSSSLDDTVCLWDFATGKKIYALPGHGRLGGKRTVAFAPDGKSFLSWGDDMYLRQWDVRTGKALLEHAIRPSGVKIPEDGDDLRGKELLFFRLGEGCFTPNAKYMVFEADGNYCVFETATGKEVRKFSMEGGRVVGRAVSPDSKLLLASAWSRGIQKKLPDGRTMVSSADNHPVAWWDLATGNRLGQIVMPEGGIGPVAFAPDGKTFAVAFSRPAECIRIVDVATSREVRKIEGFRGSVRSLAFMPDGQRLVSGMEDSTALIWDLKR